MAGKLQKSCRPNLKNIANNAYIERKTKEYFENKHKLTQNEKCVKKGRK